MLLRLLTLILLLISTSGCERRGVEVGDFDVNCQVSTIEDDSDDFDVIRDYCWFGIVGENDAPALRTSPSGRTSQRNFEKRKLTFDALSKVSIVNNTFKIFRIERQTYCHYEKSGRSLLYFVCKLLI